jgi:anti-sigma B factor antagonist
MSETTREIAAVDYVGGVCVVTVLVRELDAGTSEELSSRLLGLLNDGKSTRFVLDFEMVRYMESACFGALVTFVKWLSRFDGKIALANVSENVRFLFAVTRLDKIFVLYRDVPTALEAMRT